MSSEPAPDGEPAPEGKPAPQGEPATEEKTNYYLSISAIYKWHEFFAFFNTLYKGHATDHTNDTDDADNEHVHNNDEEQNY